MNINIRKVKKRIFASVEGEGERSFIRLLQHFCDMYKRNIHLDVNIVKGGGYKTMLQNAISYNIRYARKKNESAFLLIDSDRGERDDGWKIAELKQQSAKSNIDLILQTPNQEGLYFRMHPQNENLKPNYKDAKMQLKKIWPDYQKPADFITLKNKFSIDDLRRTSKFDTELSKLLILVGL